MSELLEVRDLRIEAPKKDEPAVKIVKGVSFDVKAGEVVALIGESGSGKTTISLGSLAYTKPGLEFSGGSIKLKGDDVLTMDPIGVRDLRGNRVAYLAQSAAATFNPALTINEQVTESAVLHGVMTQDEANARATELYHALELPDPDRIGFRYPHQVSGGQLQRLMAAMALVGRPDLLVLDEPTTALDVTVQKQILKMIAAMQARHGTTMLFVTHDLGVVARICQSVSVLHSGMVMEEASIETLLTHPAHPYSRALLAATPRYTDPDASLQPVSQSVLDGVAAEIKAADAGWVQP